MWNWKKYFPLYKTENCIINKSVHTTVSAELWRVLLQNIYMLKIWVWWSDSHTPQFLPLLEKWEAKLSLKSRDVQEEVLENLTLSILPHLTAFLKQKSLVFLCLVACEAITWMVDIFPTINKQILHIWVNTSNYIVYLRGKMWMLALRMCFTGKKCQTLR